MVWTLALIIALFLPCSAYAEPVPSEGGSDVSVEQPGSSGDQPGLPVEVAPPVPLTLYGEDGFVLSEQDTRAAAPDSRASLPGAVYESVSPNSSYANFASALLPKLGWSDDYVFFRGGENEYFFVYGNLDFQGGRFVGSGCSFTRFYYSGSSRGYLCDSGTSDVSLSVDGYIVLSNLGLYPTLTGSDALSTHMLAFVSSVALGLFAISRLLSFTLRTRMEVVSNAPAK